MKIAFIGSGEYKNKEAVIKILKKTIVKSVDIVVSGQSPRNKGDNVDIWAEVWARKNCSKPPIIHPSKGWKSEDFKARNRLIARDADEIRAFIPEGQYKSGTWNTIRWFRDLGKNLKNVKVYNQWGKLWKDSQLPPMMSASANAMTRCIGCGKIIKITEVRGKKCTKCKSVTTLGAFVKNDKNKN